jgi:hypothetical protein
MTVCILGFDGKLNVFAGRHRHKRSRLAKLERMLGKPAMKIEF